MRRSSAETGELVASGFFMYNCGQLRKKRRSDRNKRGVRRVFFCKERVFGPPVLVHDSAPASAPPW